MKYKGWGFSWSASLETKLDFFKRLLFEFFILIRINTSSWKISIQLDLEAFSALLPIGTCPLSMWVCGFIGQSGQRRTVQNEAKGISVLGCACLCLRSWWLLFWLGCFTGFWGQNWPLWLICHNSCLCLANCSRTVCSLKKKWPSNISRPKEMSS